MTNTNITVLWIAAAVSLLSGGLAAAQTPAAPWDKEPDGYRGVKWGASPDEAAEKMEGPAGVLEELRKAKGGGERRCYCEHGEQQDLCTPIRDASITLRICYSVLTLGGTALEEEWYFDKGDVYVGTRLAFDTDDYDRMRAIFVERYGPPTLRAEEPFQSRGGAKATNETLSWKGTRATVTMERFAGTISKARASVQTNAWMDEMARRDKEATEQGAKEF